MKRIELPVMTALLLAAGCGAEVNPETSNGALDSSLSRSPFYAPPPNQGAVEQVVSLLRDRRPLDAARVAAVATIPHAVWLVGGTPDEARAQVRAVMRAAKRASRIPVFAVYNLPFRDCQQYSAGGALDTAAYEAWIDGVAAGIDRGEALVILEPDGLGIIPYNTTIHGAEDWCKPTITTEAGGSEPAPGASPEARYAQLNYAVDALVANAPNASVYLDATHSAWLGVGEAAYRLVRAGVQRTKGFFLNVSNYETTAHNQTFGTWVSMCIAAGTGGPAWMLDPSTGGPHFDWCPSQYNPSKNFERDYSVEYAAEVTAGLQGLMGDAVATRTFVIDTGRNGQGAWAPTATYPDPQPWCNAPGRGVGLRPTDDTGVPLNDALLWIKVPGESDGSCTRGISGATTDPEWGDIVDPAAGQWFPEQALELARLANPRLF